MKEYFRLYVEGVGHPAPLEPALKYEDWNDKHVLNDNNWKDHLGNSLWGMDELKSPYWFLEYKRFFTEKLNSLGIDLLIETYLPQLVDGLIGAALHPLIHVGWGLYFENNEMVVDGLAYICFAYVNIKHKLKSPHSKTPSEILREVKEDSLFDSARVDGGFQPTIHNITNNLPVILKINEYAKSFKLQKDSNPKDLLYDFTIMLTELFYATKCEDFFILHGVTAIFGLYSILPKLSNKNQFKLLKSYWLMCVTVYIAQGRPPLVREATDIPMDFKDWKTLKAETIKSQDEHKVKITFVCRQFSKFYPQHNQLFFNVAYETLHSKWTF
uniref:Uncharacterized protein n=1 Tax=Arcella intermedia TaxID=1963864 RepID=A0A6B2L8F7_9EUKA